MSAYACMAHLRKAGALLKPKSTRELLDALSTTNTALDCAFDAILRKEITLRSYYRVYDLVECFEFQMVESLREIDHSAYLEIRRVVDAEKSEKSSFHHKLRMAVSSGRIRNVYLV